MTSTADAHAELPIVPTAAIQAQPDDLDASAPPEPSIPSGPDNALQRTADDDPTEEDSDSTDVEIWFRAVVLGLGAIVTLCAIPILVFGPEVGRTAPINTIVLLLGPVLIAFAFQSPSRSGRFVRALGALFSAFGEPVEAPAPPFVINASGEAQVRVDSVGSDVSMIRTSDSLQKQEQILRDMYTQGLTQAKRSFTVSLIAAVAGGGLLLWGVFLAIANAPTAGGREYASAVAAGAGIVTNILSSIFFIQSNRARRDMAQQAFLLREESQDDRRLAAARELVGGIQKDALRDQVRAHLSMTLLAVDPEANQNNQLKPNSLQEPETAATTVRSDD